ncbi:MAG: ATP-binding protein [Solirubrobacterales bacterium]|nr:ATP-binding protein [Solirubrobacterales bacterium]
MELLERLNLRSRAEVAAIPELRSQVVAYADQIGAGEAVREAVRLAVSEAVTNSVVHAYAEQPLGDVMVEAWVDDQHLMVVVADDGTGFRPTPSKEGFGVGLGLMAEMADGFLIGSRDGHPGTAVTLRFALPAIAPAPCGSI